MAKPTSHLDWQATGNIDNPPAQQKESGWVPNQKPPAQWENWINNLQDQWNKYLEAKTDSLQGEVDQNTTDIAVLQGLVSDNYLTFKSIVAMSIEQVGQGTIYSDTWKSSFATSCLSRDNNETTPYRTWFESNSEEIGIINVNSGSQAGIILQIDDSSLPAISQNPLSSTTLVLNVNVRHLVSTEPDEYEIATFPVNMQIFPNNWNSYQGNFTPNVYGEVVSVDPVLTEIEFTFS